MGCGSSRPDPAKAKAVPATTSSPQVQTNTSGSSAPAPGAPIAEANLGITPPGALANGAESRPRKRSPLSGTVHAPWSAVSTLTAPRPNRITSSETSDSDTPRRLMPRAASNSSLGFVPTLLLHKLATSNNVSAFSAAATAHGNEWGDVRDDDGWTALHWAAISGALDVARYCIESKHISADARDNDSCSALHWAAERAQLPMLQLLVNLGATVDVRDKFGQTPLFDAASHGHDACVQMLVCDFLANPDLRSITGQLPLDVYLDIRRRAHAPADPGTVAVLRARLDHAVVESPLCGTPQSCSAMQSSSEWAK